MEQEEERCSCGYNFGKVVFRQGMRCPKCGALVFKGDPPEKISAIVHRVLGNIKSK